MIKHLKRTVLYTSQMVGKPYTVHKLTYIPKNVWTESRYPIFSYEKDGNVTDFQVAFLRSTKVNGFMGWISDDSFRVDNNVKLRSTLPGELYVTYSEE